MANDLTDIAARLKKRLAAASTPEARAQEVAWAQEAVEQLSAKDPERKRTALDEIGAAAQTFSDASTFGLSGLATDVLSPGSFAADRASRRQSKEAFRGAHPVLATGLEVTGVLATPIPGGTLLKGLPKAGRAVRLGRTLTDVGLQAGTAGTVGSINEATPEGLKRALGRGVRSAGTGMAIAGPLGAFGGTIARGASRAKMAKKLDKQALNLADELKHASEINYGEVAKTARPTQAVTDVLETRTIKPYADMVRASERFANADDPTVLREAYKLMSRAERKAEKTIEGTPEFLAELEMKIGDIPLAKERILTAAEAPSRVLTPPRSDDPLLSFFERDWGIKPIQLMGSASMPKLRSTVQKHARLASKVDAFEEGADQAERIIMGTSVKGKKLRVKSTGSYLRKIGEMPPENADAALRGALGRLLETPHVSTNPLTGLGLIPSLVRTPLGYSRLRPVLKALDARRGLGTLGQASAAHTRGTLARLIGAETSR
jgi:hypothetical protein